MKRGFAILLCCLFLAPPALRAGDGIFDRLFGTHGKPATLSNSEISKALKQALDQGTRRVAHQLGAAGGFSEDDAIRIPLPSALARADKLLRRFGLGRLGDDLKQRINHAAEASIPKAGALFADAISNMTLDDARGILNGPDDAATRYFRARMNAQLSAEMLPIVKSALADSGAARVYEQMVNQYNQLPLVQPISSDLNQYVVHKAMDGMFYYVAKEEAATRKNPLKQTSKLLKKVFGDH